MDELYAGNYLSLYGTEPQEDCANQTKSRVVDEKRNGNQPLIGNPFVTRKKSTLVQQFLIGPGTVAQDQITDRSDLVLQILPDSVVKFTAKYGAYRLLAEIYSHEIPYHKQLVFFAADGVSATIKSDIFKVVEMPLRIALTTSFHYVKPTSNLSQKHNVLCPVDNGSAESRLILDFCCTN